VYNALEYVFREFSSSGENIDGAGLEKRFDVLSERLGYVVDPPLSVLVSMGNRALSNDRLDQAQSIFELLVSRYPASAWGYVSLGSVFYAKGDTETAGRYFCKTLKIDPHNRYSQEMLREIEKLESPGTADEAR